MFFLISYLLEVERNLLVCKLSVNSRESLDAALNISLVLRVKEDLDDTLSISLHPSSLSNNFSGVNYVIQDGLVNGSQCSRTWARSGSLLVAVVCLSKNGALCNNQHVLSREFLFQLSNKFLLDLIDGRKKFVGNIQDDGLGATAINLLGSCDVDVSEGGLQLRRGHLKIKKFIGYRLLELIRFLYFKEETVCEIYSLPVVPYNSATKGIPTINAILPYVPLLTNP